MFRPHWSVPLLFGLLFLPACDDESVSEHGEVEADQMMPDAHVDPDASPPPDAEPDAAAPEPCVPAEGTIGPDGGELSVETGRLAGTRLWVPAGALAAETHLTIDCDARLVPDEQASLGEAITVTADQPTAIEGWLRLEMVFDPAARPAPVEPNHLELFWRSDRHPQVLSRPPVKDAMIDLDEGRFAFDTPGLGRFQIGHDPEAGAPMMRRYTFKAITGVSMGGGAAAYLGTKYHDRFDFVGGLGGPVDWPYMLRYITGPLTGGFCSAAEGEIGTWCGGLPPSHPDEHAVHFNDWFFADNGGAFDREEYVKIFQDLAFAHGNPIIHNPHSPYLAPGMDPARLRLDPTARCAPECRDPVRLEACRAAGQCFCDQICPDGECPDAIAPHVIANGYYDDEYNPDGSLPVIAFCDGEDGGEPGVFRDESPRNRPVEIMLAVDLDGDGRRDANEPVIRNISEPYVDVGCDGVASADEPGYDPVTNPDPAGDDYDWYRNPTGTEGNWMFDGAAACGAEQGEPWSDLGLDGVAGTPQAADGGWDVGEGNGTFDYNPAYARMLERSASQIWRGLTPAERARVDFWFDGGLRDIFNFGLAAMHLAGNLRASGENIRFYDGFPQLLDNPAGTFTPNPEARDSLGQRGRSLVLRYGSRDATQAEIDAGDGAHVGSVIEILSRFLTMFDWLHNRWPDGDYSTAAPGDRPVSQEVLFDSPRTGRRYRYFVSFPPGYGRDPEQRYPVMLLLHGYGQTPDDLPVAGAVLAGAMGRGAWQKSLIVYPDGNCGSSRLKQCNDGVDNDGDGTFDAASRSRRECDADDACDDGDTCRSGWCCPADWPECGAPDPECSRPDTRGEDGQHYSYCRDGVDNDEDGLVDLDDPGCMADPATDTESECKRGSFYTDHVANRDGTPGGPQWEQMILDLLDDVDARFPTKAPADYEVAR